jgi:poly(A) polymerase
MGVEPLCDRIRLSLRFGALDGRKPTPAALTEAAGFTAVTSRMPGAGHASCLFPVSGADLIARGVSSPGPEMGARLSALEDRWVDSNFTLSKDALLDSAD